MVYILERVAMLIRLSLAACDPILKSLPYDYLGLSNVLAEWVPIIGTIIR